MENYKLSIIIPCYSVGEELLNKALKSIEIQSYKNWEIILIDDYSPKEEWKSEIVERLQKENKLKLIRNKTNLGLAISRNIGFSFSTGELILFLDPDDEYASKNFFEYINNQFVEIFNLDVLQFNWKLIFWNKKNKKWIKQKIKEEKLINEFYPYFTIKEYIHHSNFTICVWNKVYKKSFLVKNRIEHLNKNTPCEDWVFCFQVFKNSPNICITNQKFYFYRQRKNSIVDKLKKNKNHDFLYIKLAKLDIEEYLNNLGRVKGGG